MGLRMSWIVGLAAWAMICGLAPFLHATETENLGLRIVPAPGVVKAGGDPSDWDLSGAVFACGDVENSRDTVGLWFAAMYDKNNLYLLAHFLDPTPMGNVGDTRAELAPYNSDSLQVRIITGCGTPHERVTHLTGWQGSNGNDVIDLTYGKDFKGGSIKDAQTLGADQALRKDEDGKGYVQELVVPWKLLTAQGATVVAGDKIRITLEGNFLLGAGGRLSIKDVFAPDVKLDRVFTFNASSIWGWGTLEPHGSVEPAPVRLSDGREFPVSLDKGRPRVDWSALSSAPAAAAIAKIQFELPEDGFVSLIIRNDQGQVVRQLANAQPLTKGRHELGWDGLTTPNYKSPGDPVAAGNYQWSAIYHTGIGLRLRGWADNAGEAPWDSSPTSNWGGDQGPPLACATDGERVFLGWNAAEAGKGLVAAGLDGKVLWRNNRGGYGGAHLIAVDRGTVYVYDGGPSRTFYRLNAEDGRFTFWNKTDSTDLNLTGLFDNPQGAPDVPSGLAARNGKVFLSFSTPKVRQKDIAAWRPLLQWLRDQSQNAGDSLGKRLWQALDPEQKSRAMRFIQKPDAPETTLEGQPFVTEDVRTVLLLALDKLQADAALSESPLLRSVAWSDTTRQLLKHDPHTLAPTELVLRNRRVIEDALKPFVASAQGELVVSLDGESGQRLQSWPIPSPGSLASFDGGLYVLSAGRAVVALDTHTGQAHTVIDGLAGASGLAVDAEGAIYVGVGDPDNQVKVFDSAGKPLRSIGRAGGRPLLGPWAADGMRFVSGICVDARHHLWVAEADDFPKRISVWNGQSGQLVRELFGPTHYGASGGAIQPTEPTVMFGAGCEWRLNPDTGRALCVAAVERKVGMFALFATGTNGRTYLASASNDQVRIYERLGEGQYRLRSTVICDDPQRTTTFWADDNDDQLPQPGELVTVPTRIKVSGGWYLNMNRDLSLVGVVYNDQDEVQPGMSLPVVGFTACGAPRYDPHNARRLPRISNSNLSSPDNRFLLSRGQDGEALFRCYDMASGNLKWTYPNLFAGVHGSHVAPPAQAGLVRGAFGIIGNAQLPPPAGAVWAVNTNFGEWHLLTQDGYYLTRLFQGDPLKVKWPDKATPGAVLDNAPAGMGGEDFGGSFMQAADGTVYAQAGKVALWNVQVVGLASIKALSNGSLHLSADDVRQAGVMRAAQLQAAVGIVRAVATRATPTFTGNLTADFKGATALSFAKVEKARVRCALAWDDQHLYVAWEVRDDTPWQNSAEAPEQMYLHGDTVDLQLAAKTDASASRSEAAEGDLRLSIGSFHGKPTAVLYRPISQKRNPRVFSSGVVARYQVDQVEVLDGVKIHVEQQADHYVVEAAVPWPALGIEPRAKLTLRGDVGATHGDPAGQRTRLRTYWSNQHTGIVDDAVFELKLEPRNWGQITLAD